MSNPAFLPTVPHAPPLPAHRIPPTCARSTTPSSNPSPSSSSLPRPLPPHQTTNLLSRMLAIAVQNEQFSLAASLRDQRLRLLQRDPTYRLRAALAAAEQTQNFRECTRLRNCIELEAVLATAENHKPRFPIGLVVVHKRLGFRMVLFGADHCCRAPRRKMEQAAIVFMQRGERQPWYHAAVDERDKTRGDNIVYVAEDDCVPAAPGVSIVHPITRIMFNGLHHPDHCPGLSCYVPSDSGGLDD